MPGVVAEPVVMITHVMGVNTGSQKEKIFGGYPEFASTNFDLTDHFKHPIMYIHIQIYTRSRYT